MSVEDRINEERDEINELEIDDSIKESMLKTFDETVSLYHGKDGIEAIARTICYIAYKTRSEEATIETAKLLQLYSNKKGAETIADIICKTVRKTKSDKALIETVKTLQLYKDKEEAARVILKIAWETESDKSVIETAKTLNLYHNKQIAEKVLNAIKEVARKVKGGEKTRSTIKKLRDTKDIHNLNLKKWGYYLEYISDHINRSIESSLSLKDINNITNTYSLTLDFCKGEEDEFLKRVKKGFFYHLNKATDKGKTIDDKLKIMNKWSDNVYTTFKDHPEYFMEFIR